MSQPNCDACQDTGTVYVKNYTDRLTNQYRMREVACEECCEHAEHDHGICLDCGKDNYESLAARAENNLEAV